MSVGSHPKLPHSLSQSSFSDKCHQLFEHKIIETLLRNDLYINCYYEKIDNIRKMFDKYNLHEDRIANINFKYKDENTVLHIASKANRAVLVETLIELGSDIECKNKQGRTPLHILVLNNNYEIVNMLLSFGANINCVDNMQYTPLMYACLNGYDDICELLLNHNADISLKNKYQETCVDLIKQVSTMNVFKDYLSQDEMNVYMNSYTNRIYCDNDVIQIKNRKDNILSIIHRVNQYQDLIRNSGMFFNEINKYNKLNEMYNKLPNRLKVSDFDIIKLLGKGGFGEVYLVQLKKTKNIYALKAIDKKRMLQNDIKKYVENERKVYERFHSPFIINFYRAFQSNLYLYLLIENMPNGDLKSYIKKYKTFTESEVKLISAQLILALEHLHKQGIIYRDLKPDNILIDSEGYIKLGDFGLCKENIIDNYSSNSFCGSIAYIPPEILNREGHGRAVDWYLLGTVIYELLMSFPPYFTKLGKTQLMHNILGGKLKFYDKQLSDEAVDLIKKLLERNISKRLGSGLVDSAEIKEHPFYKGINFDAIYNKQFIPPSKLRTPIVRHKKLNEKIPIEEWYCYKDLNSHKVIKEDNNEGNSNEEDTVDRSHSGNNANESEDEQKENYVEGWDFKGVFKPKGK